MNTGDQTARPSCIISSARTSPISTRCSGRRCSRGPATASRAASSCTAFSPSTARRCPSRAAPSSLRRPTSSTCNPSTCATTTPSSSGRARTTSISTSMTSSPASIPTWSASSPTSPAAAPASSPASLADGWPLNWRIPALYAEFAAAAAPLAARYEAREYGRAMREIMRLADRANQYIDERKPWALAKDPSRAAEVQAVCTDGINLFRVLTLYLKPVLPRPGAARGSLSRRRTAALAGCRRTAAGPRHRRVRAAHHAHRTGGSSAHDRGLAAARRGLTCWRKRHGNPVGGRHCRGCEPSISTLSSRWTCGSLRSLRPKPWTAPTSCCA